MALRELHCVKSLEKPRISFCRPMIKGKFLSDESVNGSEHRGRRRDARNSINMGRAVTKIVALAQSSNSLLLPFHIQIKYLEQKEGNG